MYYRRVEAIDDCNDLSQREIFFKFYDVKKYFGSANLSHFFKHS